MLISTLKSTENCVCILHNLSYQVEAELPKKYTKDLTESRQNLAHRPKTVSCFPSRSAKITEVIPSDNNPHQQNKRCGLIFNSSSVKIAEKLATS